MRWLLVRSWPHIVPVSQTSEEQHFERVGERLPGQRLLHRRID
jgi:hypothetical protein